MGTRVVCRSVKLLYYPIRKEIGAASGGDYLPGTTCQFKAESSRVMLAKVLLDRGVGCSLPTMIGQSGTCCASTGKTEDLDILETRVP